MHNPPSIKARTHNEKHELVGRKEEEFTPPLNAPFKKLSEIIIADCSYSMNNNIVSNEVNPSQTRRIDAVNEAISAYGDQIQTIAFSHDAELHVGRVNLEPKTSTRMHIAFDEAKKWLPTYLLVLSDGAVDDPGYTLTLARELAAGSEEQMWPGSIIDTLYIGPDDKIAEKFMADLAEIGHGRFRRYDMTKPQQFALTHVVQGFLPPPTSQIEL